MFIEHSILQVNFDYELVCVVSIAMCIHTTVCVLYCTVICTVSLIKDTQLLTTEHDG